MPSSKATKCCIGKTHILLDELADAVAGGTRKEYMESVATVPLLIIDDFGMRKLPQTAAEDLLEIMHAATNASAHCSLPTVLSKTGEKLLGDVAAVSAMLDRLLHHGHVLKVRPAELAYQKRSRQVGNDQVLGRFQMISLEPSP